MTVRTCRDLPGGFCLGMVTVPHSQNHLKCSPLPSSLHPGAAPWHKGRGSCRSREQDSHQPHSGHVAEGITSPKGQSIHILQGSLSLVCKTAQLWQGLGRGCSRARPQHRLVAGCSKGLRCPRPCSARRATEQEGRHRRCCSSRPSKCCFTLSQGDTEELLHILHNWPGHKRVLTRSDGTC